MAENKYSYWNDSVDVGSDSGLADVFAEYDEAKAPVQVPAGKYIAVLKSWKVDRNSNGTPCLKFSFQIQEGEFSGLFVVCQQWLTSNAMGYTKQFCDSIGIDPRKTVADYTEIQVELVTMIQKGNDGRKYTSVVSDSVRRIVPNTESVSSAPAPAPAESEIPGSF